MSKSTPPLTDGHFRAIGRITVHFEYLHLFLLFWLWELIGAPQRIGQIVTGGRPFGGTVKVLGALMAERAKGHPALIKEFQTLLARAAKCEEMRNEIVHSIWGGGGESAWRSKMKVRRTGIHFDSKTRHTAAALDAIADRFEELTHDLQKWFMPQASPSKGDEAPE